MFFSKDAQYGLFLTTYINQLLYFVDTAIHAIYAVSLRLLQLTDTCAFSTGTNLIVEEHMNDMRRACSECCPNCCGLFMSAKKEHEQCVIADEFVFAHGYLLHLVYILRAVAKASRLPSTDVSDLFVKGPCLHLKLFYQFLELTSANLNVSVYFDAARLHAIAGNWLATRQTTLMVKSHYFKVTVGDVDKLVNILQYDNQTETVRPGQMM